jgi:hypothetical protein
MTELGNLLYTLVVAGLGSVATFLTLVFTRLGDRLFDHALHRNLETFKHGLEEKIEALRARLARLSDRSVRSNEREYVAIVAAWESYVESYLKANNCIARFDQFSDLNKKTETELDEWINNADLSADFGKELRGAKDRNAAYSRFLQWKALRSALQANFDSRLCLRKQGIFIPRELEAEFLTAIDMISELLAGQQAEFDNRATQMTIKLVGNFSQNGPGVYEALKDAARSRLMYEEKSSSNLIRT